MSLAERADGPVAEDLEDRPGHSTPPPLVWEQVLAKVLKVILIPITRAARRSGLWPRWHGTHRVRIGGI